MANTVIVTDSVADTTVAVDTAEIMAAATAAVVDVATAATTTVVDGDAVTLVAAAVTKVRAAAIGEVGGCPLPLSASFQAMPRFRLSIFWVLLE